MLKASCRFLNVNIVLIIALVLAGLSPFCAQRSAATSLLEICTINGLQTIEMEQDGSPLSDTPATKKPCPYCFTTHLAKLVPDQTPIALPKLHYLQPAYHFAYQDVLSPPPRTLRYEARAPPYALSI